MRRVGDPSAVAAAIAFLAVNAVASLPVRPCLWTVARVSELSQKALRDQQILHSISVAKLFEYGIVDLSLR